MVESRAAGSTQRPQAQPSPTPSHAIPDTCCICLQDMSHIDPDGPTAVTLPCGHRNSCEDCVANLINSTFQCWAKCPICRSWFKFSKDSPHGNMYEACQPPEEFCLSRFESAPASHYAGLRQAFLDLPRPSAPQDSDEEWEPQNPRCVCGEELYAILNTVVMQRCRAGGAYSQDSEGCQCDVCGRRMAGRQSCWHCPRQTTGFHPIGFDVCMACAGHSEPRDSGFDALQDSFPDWSWLLSIFVAFFLVLYGLWVQLRQSFQPTIAWVRQTIDRAFRRQHLAQD